MAEFIAGSFGGSFVHILAPFTKTYKTNLLDGISTMLNQAQN